MDELKKRRKMHLTRGIFEFANHALKDENKGSISGFFLLLLPPFFIFDLILLPFADWKGKND